MTEKKRDPADDDLLIVVNDRDELLGYKTKAACHDGDGVLHRAFSVFIFNGAGQLLIQQRSEDKRLWPMFWSNSCCSHPRKGEEIDQAAPRRVREELGLETPLRYLYKFIYHARFGGAGSEHELCSVLIGKTEAPVRADPDEIADHRFIDLAELDRELETKPEIYTPWFRMEWQRIREGHAADLKELLG